MRNGNLGRGGFAVAAGAAVAGLAAGLAATAGRRAALQAAEAAISGDWADALKAEHLDIIEILDLIDHTAPAEAGRRRKLARRLKAVIDKHAFQEENVIYPAVRLADGANSAHRLVDDHADVKTLLYQLDRADPSTEEWMEIVGKLRVGIETHVRKEEDEVFPALHARLSPEQSAELTSQMLKNGAKLV
jgi:hemerythrin-like domain-containing protein